MTLSVVLSKKIAFDIYEDDKFHVSMLNMNKFCKQRPVVLAVVFTFLDNCQNYCLQVIWKNLCTAKASYSYSR